MLTEEVRGYKCDLMESCSLKVSEISTVNTSSNRLISFQLLGRGRLVMTASERVVRGMKNSVPSSGTPMGAI